MAKPCIRNLHVILSRYSSQAKAPGGQADIVQTAEELDGRLQQEVLCAELPLIVLEAALQHAHKTGHVSASRLGLDPNASSRKLSWFTQRCRVVPRSVRILGAAKVAAGTLCLAALQTEPQLQLRDGTANSCSCRTADQDDA